MCRWTSPIQTSRGVPLSKLMPPLARLPAGTVACSAIDATWLPLLQYRLRQALQGAGIGLACDSTLKAHKLARLACQRLALLGDGLRQLLYGADVGLPATRPARLTSWLELLAIRSPCCVTVCDKLHEALASALPPTAPCRPPVARSGLPGCRPVGSRSATGSAQRSRQPCPAMRPASWRSGWPGRDRAAVLGHRGLSSGSTPGRRLLGCSDKP